MKVTQLCPTLCMSYYLQPHRLQPGRLLCPWGFSRQECWSWLSCRSPGDLPNPGIKPKSPTLQADSLQTEPPGKPKKTGVGSLSLLQGIFPTQESNQNPWFVGGFFTSWATREAQYISATTCNFISRYRCKRSWHESRTHACHDGHCRVLWQGSGAGRQVLLEAN